MYMLDTNTVSYISYLTDLFIFLFQQISKTIVNQKTIPLPYIFYLVLFYQKKDKIREICPFKLKDGSKERYNEKVFTWSFIDGFSGLFVKSTNE
ncbi:hypothetical protein BBH51_07635 [Aggregatibacter actinomycetemcomitans]|nr:hypothetical protein BBH51_07635 [Aggregatibacter actinomycetemcomitans]KYK86731.1 hypothetical protein SA2200_06555 [Aggregatibacter actinomycetemcomitans serotype d str. SA2200]KYK87899.1 hypothetical protein SC29R_04975 [Aggregatibacter actinomycetemcomitans serotype f str. SC29R]OZV15025.1 hypothetical protein RO04_11300 [Aggregatibacter actinomycetemcomitans]BAS48770.1 hypothetical protein AANUM_1539 [Aggregatibacter actinomycetemcomitans NUM4039]